MFYRGDTLEEIVSEHLDLLKLQLLCDESAEASFYIYSSHLKTSQGAENEQERLAGVIVIRADADSLPDSTQLIFAGDMNFYHAGEPGYLEFLSAWQWPGL